MYLIYESIQISNSQELKAKEENDKFHNHDDDDNDNVFFLLVTYHICLY